MAAVLLLLLFAAPFWEAKAPTEWTSVEAQQMLADSPWAKSAEVVGRMTGDPIPAILLSAQPVRDAIECLDRTGTSRRKLGGGEQLEYQRVMAANPGKYIMLGVELFDNDVLSDAKEMERIDKGSLLRIGKRKIKLVDKLPPSTTFPYLVLVFPRDVPDDALALRFELYVPINKNPFREVEFGLGSMKYRGKLEF